MPIWFSQEAPISVTIQRSKIITAILFPAHLSLSIYINLQISARTVLSSPVPTFFFLIPITINFFNEIHSHPWPSTSSVDSSSASTPPPTPPQGRQIPAPFPPPPRPRNASAPLSGTTSQRKRRTTTEEQPIKIKIRIPPPPIPTTAQPPSPRRRRHGRRRQWSSAPYSATAAATSGSASSTIASLSSRSCFWSSPSSRTSWSKKCGLDWSGSRSSATEPNSSPARSDWCRFGPCSAMAGSSGSRRRGRSTSG